MSEKIFDSLKYFEISSLHSLAETIIFFKIGLGMFA